jgi:hypothetical protein
MANDGVAEQAWMRRFHDAALPHLDDVWARATDALRAAGLPD